MRPDPGTWRFRATHNAAFVSHHAAGRAVLRQYLWRFEVPYTEGTVGPRIILLLMGKVEQCVLGVGPSASIDFVRRNSCLGSVAKPRTRQV
jgi:hypothetical protein